MMLGVAWTINHWSNTEPRLQPGDDWGGDPAPLVMQGGDPHLRALLLTISMAESNLPQPYQVLYGGQQISDLSEHPDICVTIVAGPNTGDCTTAAGRYQFLSTTWEAKAQQYHPNPPGWYTPWAPYSFEPQYQDIVTYRWLADTDAWGLDLAQLLADGQIDRVLEMLSGTWTSLGYGIEDNSMTPYLTEIYGQILQDELAQ
jgi:muramidase (phage lysozyme)